jgi:hypothetical protein
MSSPNKRSRVIVLALTVATLVGGAARGGPPSEPPRAESGTAKDAAPRHREGTLIADAEGIFRSSGGRQVFRQVDGKTEYRLLENLALERALRCLDESRSERVWLVTGTVTEYQGENFLLLNRAVMTSKSISAPPKAARPTSHSTPSRTPLPAE